MKKKLTHISIAIILTGATLLYLASYCKPQSYIVIIKNKSFYTEIADTRITRQNGLSNRESLGQDQAMLFIFSKAGHYNFVMRKMNFPLDIIFINNNTIIDIKKNLPPEGAAPKIFYSAEEVSDMVLEINAGLSDDYNFNIGDKIFLDKKTNKNHCLLLQNMLKFK